MFYKRIILIVLMLLMVILSACAPASTPTPTPASPAASPQAGSQEQTPYVLAAKAALSQKLGVAADQVRFVSAKPVDWSDSCLGLGGPAESCAQMLTPGYNVSLNAQGADHEVHTNQSGSVVRIKE